MATFLGNVGENGTNFYFNIWSHWLARTYERRSKAESTKM